MLLLQQELSRPSRALPAWLLGPDPQAGGDVPYSGAVESWSGSFDLSEREKTHEQDFCIFSQTIRADWVWAYLSVPVLLTQLLRSACVCASFCIPFPTEMEIRAHSRASKNPCLDGVSRASKNCSTCMEFTPSELGR